MAEENLKDSMGRTMSALRERLKQASENLSKLSENPDRLDRDSPPKDEPAGKEPLTARTAALRPLRTATPPGAVISAESLSRNLKHQSSKLGSMVSGTEDEFLNIGARLHDFHHRAHKISEMSEYIARLINDKDVEKTVTELNWILSMLKEWLSSLPKDEGISNRRRRAEKVVERTESCLGSLTAKHVRSAALARTFAARSDNVTKFINEVVRSLQYHDITRQRIEHVVAELDGLIERVDRACGRPLEKELAAESGCTCRELANVLMTTREEFIHAALSITENLDMVASNASAISEEIRSTTKGESESEKSFLSGMGNWLSALADTLEGFSDQAAAGGGIHAALSPGAAETGHVGQRDERAEFTELIEILNGMVKSMRRVNGNILYHLSLIDDSGKSLSEDIGREIGMFEVHEKLTEVVDDVTSNLLSLAEECGSAGPHSSGDHRRPSGKTCAAGIRIADAHGEEVEIF